MQETRQQPLFSLGQLVATPGALAALEKAGQGPLDFLSRHVHGDWGDLCEEDRRGKPIQLGTGIPALEQLSNPCGDAKLYVITEADRSVTTILLPEEY